MPYINRTSRRYIDKVLDELAQNIETKGDLNYTICELVGRLITETGISYTNMSEKIDAVHDAEVELRRRLLNPYEDDKIIENGDVSSFSSILNLMGK